MFWSTLLTGILGGGERSESEGIIESNASQPDYTTAIVLGGVLVFVIALIFILNKK